MIACSSRAPLLALIAASVLCAAAARADEPPSEQPPAPPPPEAPQQTPTHADGAPSKPRATVPIDPVVRRVDASEPRKVTGMVLTAIGIFHGFAGSVILGSFAAIDGGGGFGLTIGLLFGAPLMGEGLILTSIGAPLWVSGAKTVERVDASSSDWVPSVGVGPGSGSATWRF